MKKNTKIESKERLSNEKKRVILTTRRRTLESASFGFEFDDIGNLKLNILDLDDLIHFYVLTGNVDNFWLL